jgi:hypothetical protein
MKFVRTQHPTRFVAATLACAALGSLVGAQLESPAQIQFDLKPPGLVYQKSPSSAAAPSNGAPLTPHAKPSLPAGMPLAAARPDHSRMYYSDSDSGDAVWARGKTYKARFSSEGVEYTPLFGASAPANYPLALEIASVTIAGDALELQAGARPERDGDRVVLHRGALDETYDLTPSELEQSFVFASLPVRGALSMRIGFQGEFQAQAVHGGVRFANTLGDVTCSSVVAFDAGGRSIALEVALDGDTLAIDVPASFVAGAQLPLTIDPVLTMFTVDNSPDDNFAADVAYDVQTDTWRTVYEERISQTDTDLYTFAFDSNGLAVTASGFYIDQSAERWAHPRIANNYIAEQFFVVAEVGAIGSRQIKGLWISAVTQGHGTPFTIENNFSGEKINPDIGGDPAANGPTYYCVVFERVYSATDHDIWARILDSTGAQHFPSPVLVDNSANTLDGKPAISKSDGPAPSSLQDWTVVWEHQALQTDHDIFGARIHWSGSITNPTFLVLGSFDDELEPRVSSPLDVNLDPRPVLVAVEMHHVWNDSDIQLVEMAGSNFVTTANLSYMEGWDSVDQRTPVVDCVGQQFAVAFAEQWYPGSYDYDMYVAHVGASGNVLFETAQRDGVAYTGEVEARPALCAELSGGASNHAFCTLWDVGVGASSHDVMGAMLVGTNGGSVESYCGSAAIACPCGNPGLLGRGCGNSADAQGALLSILGGASVSNDSLVFTAIGMPASASCLFFEGTTAMNAPFGDGVKCVGGGIVRLGLKISVGGAANYPEAGDLSISAKGLVPPAGAIRYYQAWYRDPAAYCTSATFNLSNALKVTWVP